MLICVELCVRILIKSRTLISLVACFAVITSDIVEMLVRGLVNIFLGLYFLIAYFEQSTEIIVIQKFNFFFAKI